MAGLNKVMLIGHLGKDPEVRHLENGTAVANFSMATSETYKKKDSDEKVTNTEWHNIVLWRGLAELAEKYLKKGDQIYLEGKIKTRKWTDKDNNDRYTTEIIGDQMVMLGSKKQSSTQQQNDDPGPTEPDNQETPEHIGANEEDDDLPF